MIIKEYNLDFSTMSDSDITEWGRNIAKDNVILVRNQNLDEEGITRVCGKIGRLMKPKEFFMHPDYPALYRVTNERKDGEKIGIFADKELGWHSNGNGRDQGKFSCVSLYCVRTHEDSVTSFCDTRQAYIDLPDDIKKVVEDVDGLYKFENNTFYDLDSDDKELKMFEQSYDFPDGKVKPLVYTHPYTEEKGLYFPYHFIRKMWNRNFGQLSGSLDQKWLMDYLMDHVFQEKYIAHHTWEPGDFLFMDQYHSLHKRNAVTGDRLLYRLCLDYKWSFR